MPEEQLDKKWKEDMQILKTQEEGENTDMETEAIPSVHNRKIEMPSTEGMGMQGKGWSRGNAHRPPGEGATEQDRMHL